MKKRGFSRRLDAEGKLPVFFGFASSISAEEGMFFQLQQKKKSTKPV